MKNLDPDTQIWALAVLCGLIFFGMLFIPQKDNNQNDDDSP